MAVPLHIPIGLDYLAVEAEDQSERMEAAHTRQGQEEMQNVVELLVAGILVHGYPLGRSGYLHLGSADQYIDSKLGKRVSHVRGWRSSYPGWNQI